MNRKNRHRIVTYLVALLAVVMLVTSTFAMPAFAAGKTESTAKDTISVEAVTEEKTEASKEEPVSEPETKAEVKDETKEEETRAAAEVKETEETKAAEEASKEPETKKEETTKQAEPKKDEVKGESGKASDDQKEVKKTEEEKQTENQKQTEEEKTEPETEKESAESAKNKEEATVKQETETEKERNTDTEKEESDKNVKEQNEKVKDEADKKDNEDKKDKKDNADKKVKDDKKLKKSHAISLQAVDNSTKLPDGEYTDFGWEFAGGTGKAKLTLEKIIVKDGKATGLFTASSSNFTHIYYAGNTSTEYDDPQYYDPAKDKCGDSVVAFSNKQVQVPIHLNGKQDIACRTIAMTEPHWVQYHYTVTIDETEKEIKTNLSISGSVEKLALAKAVLGTMERSGKMTLYLTVDDKTFTKVYLGTAAQAEENTGDAIALSSDKQFVIPSVTDGKRFRAAFYCTEDQIWHDAYLTLDASAKTLQLKEGKKADYTKVEAAKKNVPEDLSVYKEARVKTLKKALKAVREGLYASQQEEVDAYAEKIQQAIDALEKDQLTIRIKALNEETGKVIKGAEITVKDSTGKVVEPVKAGVYKLDEGKYTLIATAKNYEKAVRRNYKPEVEETIELKLKPKEIIPPGTTIFQENEKNPKKTNLFNKTKMFKVVKGVLVSKNGKRTLTVTLSASGYHYLFKGTYEEAIANGLNKKNWIKGKVNADGKWEFVIPLKESETYIPLISISSTHLEKAEAGEEELGEAFFARQLVLDLKKKTLTAGDYDETVKITVISKTDRFKAESKGSMEVIGSPSSNNYSCIPVITMQDGTFSKAFIGTAANAAKSGAKVINRKNNAFTFTFSNYFSGSGKVRMFEDQKPIAVAFYDSEKKAWVDYKLTIDKAAKTVTIEALKEDEAPPEEPETPEEEEEQYQDDRDKGTSPVDSGTTLKDGTYTPKNFRFSGGTGKVIITCQSIEVKNGQAYATIRFGKASGGEASVDMLRAAGQTFNGYNTFTIPVSLNANNTIVARTTAMSQPHWIEYTIYIAMDEPGKETDGKDVSEQSTDLDEESPEILGLTASGETEVVYSDLIRIFNYEDGYYLIEVDAVRDTARDTLDYRTEMAIEAIKKQAEEKESQTEDVKAAEEELTDVLAEEGGSESKAVESISDKIAKLYENEIIKYLVVPEGKEVPAGLDKEVIIIKQPADRTYISSADALEQMGRLEVLSNITSIGLSEDEVKEESILAGMKKAEGEDGAIADGGSYDDWNLKTMIKDQTNLAVESAQILPREETTIEQDMENFVRLGQRSAQLEMAMFIDRSSDETNELAKAEWFKVYGIIYKNVDKANSLYQEAIAKATEQEKKEATDLLKKRADEKKDMKADAQKAAEKQTKDAAGK